MNKSMLKRVYLVSISLVLLTALLGISVMPVSAETPTQVKFETPYNPGDKGTYFDIVLDPSGDKEEVAGFCIQQHVSFNWTTYNAKLYNFFGGDPVPPGTTESIIRAIAYIINNVPEGAAWYDIQWAIWYFTDGTECPDDVVVASNYPPYNSSHQTYIDQMIQGAINHPTYSPPSGARNPIFVYVSGDVQLTFFWDYTIPPPVPELPAGLLLGFGIICLGGIGWFGYHKRSSRVSAG